MNNDRIRMNMEILNIIHAVIDYKRFIISNNYIIPEEKFDWYKSTQKYYNALPLPKGMSHNISDFEKVLSYNSPSVKEILEKMDNTKPEQLNEFDWK